MVVVEAFSFKFSFDAVLDKVTKISALSHTHPLKKGVNQEGFSTGDAKMIGKIGRTDIPPRFPYYVRTPMGDVRVLTPEESYGAKAQRGTTLCPSGPCVPIYSNNRD